MIESILHSEADTVALATALVRVLHPGDTVLLAGPVGAGKSAFARAAIQARQIASGGAAEDVPSPSYTLVQTYEAGPVSLWHADLYRLGDAEELVELGLDEAMESAIVFIEWPERMGASAPVRALRLELIPDQAAGADTRRGVRITSEGGGWDAALRAAAGVLS